MHTPFASEKHIEEIATLPQALQRLFDLQKTYQQQWRKSTAAERIAKLQKLQKAVLDNRQAIRDAVWKDFKKSPEEADISEIFPVTSAIKFVVSRLRRWMRPKRVATPLPLLGTSSHIYYEPKGVCLIIAPWNYPFFLAIEPLVSAIAAGNTAIIKPSEMTPHTSAVIQHLMSTAFQEQEVAVVEGGVEVSTELLKLPFDHIFFTGSPQVGKVVMEAASKHLTSVTLELGGKSPVLIDESADLKDAAEKVVAGKLLNCGQTCIAPDYVLIQEQLKAPFLEAYRQAVERLYGSATEKEQLTRIVNQRHFQRIQSLLEDASAKGAQIVQGGHSNAEDCYIAPTVVDHTSEDMRLMQEEIFGPVLPIKTFGQVEEALQYIEQKPKPLAFYIFSRNKARTRYILQSSSAGGTCINDTLIHILNTHLPFGGVNNSGIGKAHGHFGFLAFSNERAVLRQRVGLTGIKMLYPPYTPRIRKMIDLLMKWF